MANNPQFSGYQPFRPPNIALMDPSRSFPQPLPSQSWQPGPPQQSQQFVAVASQHFQPAAHVPPPMNVALPSLSQQPQFVPPVQQLPPRPGQPIQNALPSPAIPMAASQPIRPFASESLVPRPGALVSNNFMPVASGPAPPLSAQYTFSYGSGQQMNANAARPPTQYQQMPVPAPLHVPLLEQPGLSSEGLGIKPVTPRNNEQSSISSGVAEGTAVLPKSNGLTQTDWIEHTSANGRRYYYNKKTKQSVWEKPLELMTPTERADANTDWKEYTSPDGRKYYYNKVTKQSKWELPEELKLAREQMHKTCTTDTQPEKSANSVSVSSPLMSAVTEPTVASSSAFQGAVSTPFSAASINPRVEIEPPVVSGSPVSLEPTALNMVTTEISSDDAKEGTAAGASAEDALKGVDIVIAPKTNTEDIPGSSEEVSVEENESGKHLATDKNADKVIEEKLINPEPLPYANKLEAKIAFKALLESANVGSDWTWERAMRVIINDKRYGALKTLGERKEAFNEFVAQRKKREAEERRIKQKKAREDFKKMLEESEELTSSSKWSMVVTMFEEDERFKAVERDRERKDLFENFLHELEKKEQAKAAEERKRNIAEYRQFLESCDFIKANTQWRKVQDRLEADERCSCLEKIDRLEIFQDYLRDLEKEEEEQRKLQKEEIRKAERKNRDEFRKLLEEHVNDATLTAKTDWRDYYMKIKDLPAHSAVASNTSGATPKELFEDVAEELQNQYEEDKSEIEDAIKLRKIIVLSTWTIEDLKAAISDDLRSSSISDTNLKLVFDELLGRARIKEEKEAQRRKRLGDKFYDLLLSMREINPSSTWEDCKGLFHNCYEYSSIGDEDYCREIFEEYTQKLKEQAKEYERKRKEQKEKREREKRKKERREKERHLKEEEFNEDEADVDTNIYGTQGSEKKKSSKDRERKQHKHHHTAAADQNDEDRDHSKKSRRHSRDRRKSKQHASTPESDGESKRKRHKRDSRNGSYTSLEQRDLEDGEFSDDGRSL